MLPLCSSHIHPPDCHCFWYPHQWLRIFTGYTITTFYCSTGDSSFSQDYANPLVNFFRRRRRFLTGYTVTAWFPPLMARGYRPSYTITLRWYLYCWLRLFADYSMVSVGLHSGVMHRPLIHHHLLWFLHLQAPDTVNVNPFVGGIDDVRFNQAPLGIWNFANAANVDEGIIRYVRWKEEDPISSRKL